MVLTPSRTTVLGDQGDLSAEPGTPRWVRAVYLEACSAVNDATKTREYVERWVGALLEDNNYQQLADQQGRYFMLWSDFCAARQPFGLGYSPDAIAALIQQRPTTAQLAAVPRKLLDNSGPPTAEEGAIPSNRRNSTYGTTADYLTARIARDRPDVLDAMRRGEYPSVRAAAKAAGIVSERWSVPSEPMQLAAYLRRRLNATTLARLVALLQGEP